MILQWKNNEKREEEFFGFIGKLHICTATKTDHKKTPYVLTVYVPLEIPKGASRYSDITNLFLSADALISAFICDIMIALEERNEYVKLFKRARDKKETEIEALKSVDGVLRELLGTMKDELEEIKEAVEAKPADDIMT